MLGFELQKRSRLGYFASKSFFSKHSLHSNLAGTIVRLLGCLVAEISPTVMSDPSDQSKQRIFMILNGSPETAPIQTQIFDNQFRNFFLNIHDKYFSKKCKIGDKNASSFQTRLQKCPKLGTAIYLDLPSYFV